MFNIKNIDIDYELRELKKYPGRQIAMNLNCLIKLLKEEGLIYIMDEMKEDLEKHGFETSRIDKYKDNEWVPMGLPAAFLLLCISKLSWENTDIINLGKEALNLNAFNRIVLRYFISVKSTIFRLGENWKRHYENGDIEVTSYDSKKRQAEIKIINIKLHPAERLVVCGVNTTIINLATGSNKVKIHEIEASEDKGTLHYKYKITW